MLAVLVASERDTSTKSLEKLLPKGHDVVLGKNWAPIVCSHYFSVKVILDKFGWNCTIVLIAKCRIIKFVQIFGLFCDLY